MKRLTQRERNLIDVVAFALRRAHEQAIDDDYFNQPPIVQRVAMNIYHALEACGYREAANRIYDYPFNREAQS